MNSNIKTTPHHKNPISLQNKTLVNRLPQELCTKCTEAILTVNAMSDQKALYTLWKFYYFPKRALEQFGFEPEDDSLPFTCCGFFPTELVTPLRNELYSQRTLIHPNFPEYFISEKCQKAFERLKRVTNNDMIISVVVLNKCYEMVALATEEEMERILFLLESNISERAFGGLRSMNFNKFESNVLKIYATQISSLLFAIWEEQKIDSNPNRPMAGLADMLKEKNFHLVPDSTEDTCPANNLEFSQNALHVEKTPVQITTRTILDNKEIFESFLNSCKQLEEAGFDLTNVFSQHDFISKNI